MSYILLTWLLLPFWLPVLLMRRVLNRMPQRIIISEIAGIGDVVCSTAVFKAVRAQFPQAHIALMVDSIVEDLAALDPNIDELVVFKAAHQRGFGGRLALARLLVGFDTMLCLIPSAAQLTAACWAAVPRRYSVLPDIRVKSYTWLAALMTHVHPHQSDTSFVGTQLAMLAPLGVYGQATDKQLIVTSAALEAADQLLGGQTCTWIGIAIGSGQGIKAIRPEVLANLIDRLLQDPSLGIVLIGGAKETSLAIQLSAGHTKRLVNAVGNIKLAHLPGLLKKLAVLVGVDSGVTYIADTLGVPLVYLPGPANVKDQSPNGSQKITLQRQLPCAPCSRVFVTPNRCMANNHACIDSFSAEEIFGAITQLLKEVV